MIKDLSRNGTFVNEEKIGQNQLRMIKTGDVISVIEPGIKSMIVLFFCLRRIITFFFVLVFTFRDFTPRKENNLPKELENEYFVSKKLGSGAFGEVYKLFDKKLNTYAVKYIKARSLSSEQPNEVENEIKILKKVDHVCVIRTIDIMKDNSNGVSLILEYMAGGNLLERIVSSPTGRLSEDQGRCIFYQMTHAVKYLHSKGITHRDIKPDNVLLKSDDEFTLVKISDFGLSKLVHKTTLMKTILGTPNYAAPEVLNSNIPFYSPKVDVWSMGVTLFAVISGTLPFAEEYGDVRSAILKGEYQFLARCWKQMSFDAIRLVRKLLVVDAENRLDLDEILDMKWMSNEFVGIQMAIKIMGEHEESPVEINVDKELSGFADLEPPPFKRARYVI